MRRTGPGWLCRGAISLYQGVMEALDINAAPADLLGMDRGELESMAEAMGEPAYRGRQVYQWIYQRGLTDFSQMLNLPKSMRERLAAQYRIGRPAIDANPVSVDGTRKWLLGFGDHTQAEMVLIPERTRGTLCISSQVGCTLTCTFCHTGTQKLGRNLTAQEIVSQVLIARDALDGWPSDEEDRRLTNIVFMGMGEPLYNLDNVAEAIDTISDGDGIAIGRRRITVSTAGVAPKIVELGERTNAMLAISLHATNDDLRNEIVPINRKYNLKELFEAIRAYPGLGNSRRVTFEYVMLKGVNDSLAEARDLVRLLRGVPAKINLIPFNPWPGSPYECSDWDTIEEFAEVLNQAGYASPIRTPRGRDILAACGQLRSESVKKSAAEKRREALEAAAE